VRPVQQKAPGKAPGSSSGSSHSRSCITVPLEGLLCVQDVMTARQREFEFDACFSPEATQEQVRWRNSCSALVVPSFDALDLAPTIQSWCCGQAQQPFGL
jgi:hypothetical protein